MIKIPINADPQGSITAIDRITAALKKAGMEGRKFSEIDLSHPEVKAIAEDLKRAQKNFEELKKFGRGGTAASVRKSGADDVLEWNRTVNRQFPDQKARRNHVDTVNRYVSQGTRWEPAEGGGEPGAGGSGGGGSFFGGFPGPSIGKYLGIGLGLAGIGKITSMLSQGIGSAQDESIGVDTLKRILNDTSDSFSDLRTTVRKAATGLQLTYNETVKLAQVFAKTSAYTDSRRVGREIAVSAGFARSFGLDPGQATAEFGTARWLQAGGGKNTSPQKFALMVADAVSSGKMWGKVTEVMTSMLSWVQQAERTRPDAPNVRGYMALTSAMNASGRPGLRGAAGAALIAQMDSSVRRGGSAGDAGQNFMWRALNPDGALGPYQMRYQREKGMFGKLADGRTNIEAIMELAKKQYPNPMQRADAMSSLFGTSMSQMLAMMQIDKHGSFGKLSSMMKKYNIDPKSVNPSSFQGLASIAGADDSGLINLRDAALRRGDLSAQQKQALTRATPGSDLRSVLAHVIAATGREKTTGAKTLDAMTQMKNALTNTGGPLISPINEIKNLVAQSIYHPIDAAKKLFVNGLFGGTGLFGTSDSTTSLFHKTKPQHANNVVHIKNDVTVTHKNTAGDKIGEDNLPSRTVSYYPAG